MGVSQNGGMKPGDCETHHMKHREQGYETTVWNGVWNRVWNSPVHFEKPPSILYNIFVRSNPRRNWRNSRKSSDASRCDSTSSQLNDQINFDDQVSLVVKSASTIKSSLVRHHAWHNATTFESPWRSQSADGQVNFDDQVKFSPSPRVIHIKWNSFIKLEM